MEPVPQTYVAAQQILAAELNDLCTRAAGFSPANENNFFANATPVLPNGSTEMVWIRGVSGTSITTGTLVVVDSTVDWRDRVVVVDYTPTDAVEVPGQASDYLFDYALTRRCGYTGLGALGAASAPVTAGAAPVPASGTSWAVQVVANLWLYAVPSTGELALYNNTGATIDSPMIFARATAKTGRRP